MNKIYEIKIKKYNEIVTKTVLASNAEKALVNIKRWWKKNNYSSDPDILSIEKVTTIDVVYKT